MSNFEPGCTSAEAAAMLRVDHRTILRMVKSGRLKPIAKLPGKTGAYLFARADVEALRDAEQVSE